MNKTQRTDLAVERLLKLIYPEYSELAKVSFNEEHALNTASDLIDSLTKERDDFEWHYKDRVRAVALELIEKEKLEAEKAKLQERVGKPTLDVKSIQCDRCGETLVNIPKLQMYRICNDPAQGSGKI